MKIKHISIYFISCVLFTTCTEKVFSQESETEIPKDTLVPTQKYGIRLGVDASKLVRTLFDDDYKGIELIGDYRISENMYIAGEIGNEEKTISNQVLNVVSKGSYFKAGINYNVYKNWLDMQNLIYGGLRVGAATFIHDVSSFTVYNTDNYWDEGYTSTMNTEFKGLTAVWTELLFGINAEVVNNLFLGLNVQLKMTLSEKQPQNFEILYIPGYHKTYDSGRFGFGYSYTISYLIPLKKKRKQKPLDKDLEAE